MPTVSTLDVSERVPAPVGTTCHTISAHVFAQEPATRTAPVLPAVLMDDEITEADFDLLINIAEDKNASAGRLRHPTSAIPAVKSAAE